MPASHLPPETVSHEKTARALSCPALPCVGLHPGKLLCISKEKEGRGVLSDLGSWIWGPRTPR